MAKKKKSDSNYFKLGFILLGVVLFTVIAANIYKNITNNKINNSYIAKYVSSIQYNELDVTQTEFSSDTFLYISYTGDKNIYALETKLKKVIKDNDLSDKFIYLNMKEELDKEDYLLKLNNTLGLEVPIKKLPAIIYYKDTRVIDVIDSYEGFLNDGDFTQLLEKFEINN